MCFSSTASLAAGTVLTAAGVLTFREARQPGQRLLALTPLLFGIQQLTEAAVWISLKQEGSQDLNAFSGHLFIVIAQVIWPFWVPLVIYLAETKEKRKKGMRFLLVFGGISSLRLIVYPLHSSIQNHHILYTFDIPYKFPILTAMLYLVSTLLPMFLSSLKRMPLLGSLVLFSLVISHIAYERYLLSVWCFFAALMSITIHLVVKPDTKKVVREMN
jgi:hypothetical protein